MAIIDVAARDAKEFEAILKKIKAYLKSQNAYVGSIDAGKSDLPLLPPRSYHIVIESSMSGDAGFLAREMSWIVQQSATAHVWSFDEHEGRFDWSADTYIKPASEVRIYFK